jgi:hypothetical protein
VSRRARAPRHAALAASVVLACAFAGKPEARAYTSASLTTAIPHPRYVVCKEEPAQPPPAPSRRAAPEDDLTPVPHVRAPGKLTVIPHLVDDAALAEPIPLRLASASPREQAPPQVLMRESVNGVHCLGLVRGRAAMLRVLSAPPGTHFYGHPHPRYFIADNLIAASAFDAKEAIAPIRAVFERPLPRELKAYDDFERLSMKGHAAMALAELGDVASAPKLRELLVHLETLHVGSTWRDTLQALRQLDRPTAAAYALDRVERMSDGNAPRLSGHDLEVLLELIDTKDAARAVPALTRLGAGGHDGCLAVGARLRLGDEALAKTVRPDLAGSIATNLGATCWTQIIGALAPGRSMSELPVLLFRARWESVAELALVVRDRGPAGAKDRATFVAKVKTTVAKPPQGLRDHDLALRLGALATLGDEPSLRALYAIVDAPSDDGDRPWVAATLAVRARLPEADPHAQRLLETGIQRHLSNGAIDALTSGVAATWPVKLVRELARQKSPLAALGLLQRDPHAREEAMFAVSRGKPEGACELVASAARLVPTHEHEAIDSAFWALTALGTACQSPMERLARDRAQPGVVRGAALEHLAMIRAPSAAALAAAWEAEGPRSGAERASLHRARIIIASPE